MSVSTICLTLLLGLIVVQCNPISPASDGLQEGTQNLSPDTQQNQESILGLNQQPATFEQQQPDYSSNDVTPEVTQQEGDEAGTSDGCNTGDLRASPEGKDQFEICDNSVWIAMPCAPGTWYTEELQRCTDGNEAETLEDEQEDGGDGGSIPPPSDQDVNVSDGAEQTANSELNYESLPADNNHIQDDANLATTVWATAPLSPPSQAAAPTISYAPASPAVTLTLNHAPIPQQHQQQVTATGSGSVGIGGGRQTQQTAIVNSNAYVETGTGSRIVGIGGWNAAQNNLQQLVTTNSNAYVETGTKAEWSVVNNQPQQHQSTNVNADADSYNTGLVCRLGATRLIRDGGDDAQQWYEECVHGFGTATLWKERQCAPGTIFNKHTGNCGRYDANYVAPEGDQTYDQTQETIAEQPPAAPVTYEAANVASSPVNVAYVATPVNNTAQVWSTASATPVQYVQQPPQTQPQQTTWQTHQSQPVVAYQQQPATTVGQHGQVQGQIYQQQASHTVQDQGQWVQQQQQVTSSQSGYDNEELDIQPSSSSSSASAGGSRQIMTLGNGGKKVTITLDLK